MNTKYDWEKIHSGVKSGFITLHGFMNMVRREIESQKEWEPVKYVMNPFDKYNETNNVIYINNPSESVMLAAVRRNPKTIRMFENPPDHVKQAANRRNKI
jgi:transposase-like protein